ncbi:hypothetical protein [Alteromonas lipolytica]|uniref:PEP-CTERM protein-sorting domain-containing protein n=1 Tax=Alteromonas lipolytica TaxID=1856405 RepID=A0A1E8FGC3_9ALTE|nr:hypothetical protein [Alteromonas lipolytica]OFI34981.1 hypothetical protein BFC17_15580 [Alteromonas lipolytica]GGF55612.1 hypothetical protein GCM10011338_04840 [Alteromonas lipolytica]
MKKYLIAMAVAMVASFSANASFITGVTGADMAGIEVTVSFLDGSIETATWEATSATAGGAFSETIGGWSLTLDGDSFGSNTDVPDVYVGVWNFYTGDVGGPLITALTVAILDAGFVFDILEGDNGDGTGAGRPAATDYESDALFLTFGNFYTGALAGTMYFFDEDNGFAPGQTIALMTDTDAFAEVPAPAGLSLLALGLAAVRVARRSK